MFINFTILYEDDSIIAIDKPSGTPVIPERWNKSNLSLFEYLNNYYCSCKHFFIVHRIDRDCSGLVILAKRKDVHRFLCNLFEKRKILKEYLALVEGEVKKNSGTINLPIAQRKKGPIHSIIKDTGKPSTTYYELIETFQNYSLLKVIPHTGRPNQIRLHLAAIGHAIINDPLYNKKCSKIIGKDGILIIDRLALHSYKITFIHPKNNSNMTLTAPLSFDFFNAIEFLKKQ